MRVLAAELAAVERAIATGGPIPASASLELPAETIDWTDAQRALAFHLLERLDDAMEGVALRMDDVEAAMRSLRSASGVASVNATDPPLFLDIRV